MQTSESGKALIRQHEGLLLAAYQDIGGVWTIGYGHTLGVRAGQVINGEEAESMLEQDLVAVDKCLSNSIRVSVTQNQWDALADFVFNLGCHAFVGSTLLKLLNDGNYEAASAEFPKWDHDNGKVVEGLLERRIEEQTLFNT